MSLGFSIGKGGRRPIQEYEQAEHHRTVGISYSKTALQVARNGDGGGTH